MFSRTDDVETVAQPYLFPKYLQIEKLPTRRNLHFRSAVIYFSGKTNGRYLIDFKIQWWLRPHEGNSWDITATSIILLDIIINQN